MNSYIPSIPSPKASIATNMVINRRSLLLKANLYNAYKLPAP